MASMESLTQNESHFSQKVEIFKNVESMRRSRMKVEVEGEVEQELD